MNAQFLLPLGIGAAVLLGKVASAHSSDSRQTKRLKVPSDVNVSAQASGSLLDVISKVRLQDIVDLLSILWGGRTALFATNADDAPAR